MADKIDFERMASNAITWAKAMEKKARANWYNDKKTRHAAKWVERQAGKIIKIATDVPNAVAKGSELESTALINELTKEMTKLSNYMKQKEVTANPPHPFIPGIKKEEPVIEKGDGFFEGEIEAEKKIKEKEKGNLDKFIEEHFDKAKKEEKREEKKEEKKEERREEHIIESIGGRFRQHKSKIFWIGALIFLIFIIWFVADVIMGTVRTPFGQLIADTLNQYLALDEIKKTVGTDLCIVGCYAGNLANVGTWTAAGGLGNYCQSNCVTTAKAVALGCTDCYTLSATLEDTKPIPNSENTVMLTVDAKVKEYAWNVGGTNVIIPIPPAINPVIKISGDSSSGFAINERYLCQPSPDNECALSPISGDVSSIGPNDVPVKLSADFTVPCTTSTQYNAYFNYDYNAIGISFLKFKAKGYSGTIDTPDSIASPGPLKFNSESFSDIYTLVNDEKTTEARVTFSLVNSGRSGSQINVNKITINQTTPAGYNPLELTDCVEGSVTSPDDGASGYYELVDTPTVYQGEENAVNFHCSFIIPPDHPLKTDLKQAVYYTLVATANYKYTQKITGDTIFTDTRYKCYVGTSGWKATTDSVDPTWSEYSFDDSLWPSVTLPDSAQCSQSSCDKHYRSQISIYDPSRGHIWLNVSSNDAVNCGVWTSDTSSKTAIDSSNPSSYTCSSNSGYNYCSDLKPLIDEIDSGAKKYRVSCIVTSTDGTENFGIKSDK